VFAFISGVADRGEEFLWQGDQPYELFLEQLEVWHRECYRVLKPGRFCVVNLATMARGKKSYPIPFHAVAILEKIGFNFCFEIVWHKVSGGRTRARNFIQRPFPGSFSPNIRTEYLLIFRKNPSVPFKLRLDLELDKELLVQIDDYFLREIANNVWHIPPQHKGSDRAHPCPFPIELPSRIIQLFSLPGDTVLDPFMGIGTTALAAKDLGRHFVGYELEPAFIEEALDALRKPLRRRPQILCEYTKHPQTRHGKQS